MPALLDLIGVGPHRRIVHRRIEAADEIGMRQRPGPARVPRVEQEPLADRIEAIHQRARVFLRVGQKRFGDPGRIDAPLGQCGRHRRRRDLDELHRGGIAAVLIDPRARGGVRDAVERDDRHDFAVEILA